MGGIRELPLAAQLTLIDEIPTSEGVSGANEPGRATNVIVDATIVLVLGRLLKFSASIPIW